MAVTKKQLLEFTTEENADKILGMIAGDLDPREVSPQTDLMCRQFFIHIPMHNILTMHAADELLETCGVEGWATPDGGVSYCNTGDQYAWTLVLETDRLGDEFHVGSWTDWAPEED